MKRFGGKRIVSCVIACLLLCFGAGGIDSFAYGLQAEENKPLGELLSGSNIEVLYAADVREASPEAEPVTEAQMKAEGEKQGEALRAYKLLTDTFPMTEDCAWIYPKEYAGAYIDSNGNLVISLVGRTAEMEDTYRELCGDSKKLLFKDAAHSLTELEAYASAMGGLNDAYAITGYGVDEEKGAVVVDVETEDAAAFSRALYQRRSMYRSCETSSIPVVVRESGPVKLCATQLVGGGQITAKRSSDATRHLGSICIGGKYGGKSVIITAGHVAAAKDTIYFGNENSTQVLGTTIYSRYADGQKGDFAIVEVANSYTATNMVKYSTGMKTIVGVYSKSPKGTTVYKYGYRTGYSSGTIDMTSCTIPGMTMQGFCSVVMAKSALPASGDSGGSVYTYYSPDNGYNICGSISAHQSTGIMYYSPLVYAENLGFTLK